MNAYYYSFERTGVESIDRILAEVAWAGKAQHSTEDWASYGSPTVVDNIQAAADLAASEVRSAERAATAKERERAANVNPLDVECDLCGAGPRRLCYEPSGVNTLLCHDLRWQDAILADTAEKKEAEVAER
jgi:hypothetical protein